MKESTRGVGATCADAFPNLRVSRVPLVGVVVLTVVLSLSAQSRPLVPTSAQGSPKNGAPGGRATIVKGDRGYTPFGLVDDVIARGLRKCVPAVVPTAASALKGLSAVRYDCAVLGERCVPRFLDHLGLDNLTAFAMRQGDRQLLATLDAGQETVTLTGRGTRIHDHWFSGEAQQLHWANRIIDGSMIALVVLTVAVLAFMLWSAALRRQVSRRTAALQAEVDSHSRTAQALRRERDLVRNLVAVSPVPIVGIDASGAIEMVNNRGAEVLGLPEEELKGRRVLADPEWRVTDYDGNPIPEEASPLRQMADTGEPVWGLRIAIETEAEGRRYFIVNGAPLLDEEQRITGFVAAVENVTDKLAAEKALRASEERLRLALDAVHDGVWENRFDGLPHYFSNHMFSMLGYGAVPPDEAGEFFGRRVHPEDRAAMAAAYKAMWQPGQDAYEARFRIQAADGAWRHIQSRGRCVARDEEGKPRRVIGTHTDITDRLEVEMHLRQQQKLESIGTLAGGVAHEINNPINGIMNYAQLIKDELGDPQIRVGEYASEIIVETKRVADIVRNLLQFARRDKEEHSPSGIEKVVESTLSLIRTVIRRDQITLQVDVSAGLPRIICRSQQIQQVLMNLLTNARDAVNSRYEGYHPDKVIRVTVCRVTHKDRDWVRTSVEDHGVGIPETVRERMFDPFFTTKPRGKGTGLGLSISHGIVREHNGELWVESEPESYTRFHLDLPAETDTVLREDA